MKKFSSPKSAVLYALLNYNWKEQSRTRKFLREKLWNDKGHLVFLGCFDKILAVIIKIVQKRAVLYDLLNSVQADISTKKQGQTSLHIPTRKFLKWWGIFSVLLSFDKIFCSRNLCKKWMTTAMIEMNLKENHEIKVRKNEGTSLMC